MDILISVSTFVQKNGNDLYEKDESVSFTTDNIGSTLFSAKEYHSLKIWFDYVNLPLIECLIMQTCTSDSYKLFSKEGGSLTPEVLLNDCQSEFNLVPGIYAIEIHLKDGNMYEYFYEILEQHTTSSLSLLRDNINSHAQGLAINPSLSGQSILSTLDETDHLLELLKKRWSDALGQIELIIRNPVQTLGRTHTLRNELVKIDPYVIRYRDKHVGSRKVLQPRNYVHYDNPDNYALLNALGVFLGQIDRLAAAINDKFEDAVSEMSRLNKLRDEQSQDFERIERNNFDQFEKKTALSQLNYTRMCIGQRVGRLKHIKSQQLILAKLRNEVFQEKSLLENMFQLRITGYKRDVPLSSVLYKNCTETLTKSLDLQDLGQVEPHKGFNYKRSEILFEYLGLLKTFRILLDMGFKPDEELKHVVKDYMIPSESRFRFHDGELDVTVIYDTEALTSYDPDTYVGLVSENSLSRRPDIVIECFKNGIISGIVIIEAKYRKVFYLHNNIKDSHGKCHKTEVEQTMSDYRSLKYYLPDAREKEVGCVIVFYPKQEKSVPENWGKDFGMLKRYGHFVATDITSGFDEKDSFYNLVKDEIKKAFE